MSDSLRGARVALLEARRESELASLVRRHGGEPICAPALREVERDCREEVERAIDAASGRHAVVVLATGVGLDRWLSTASALGRAEETHAALAGATVVCRGPKPVAVLKRERLTAHVRVPPPHTTAELLASLESVDVRDRAVVFVHDGGGSRTVPLALERRGARVVEIQPYTWGLPEDIEPLRALVHSILEGGIDAVAVTTQVQARHLLQVAESMGLREALGVAMRERVVVAAIGPTSAHALDELGIPAHVVADPSKMGPLVIALAGEMDRRAAAPTRPKATEND
jgi:uroporphyrinogen-III synthase